MSLNFGATIYRHEPGSFLASEPKVQEYEFVEELPDSLKCPICLSVVKQPQQHGECGKLFCLSCINEHRKKSSQCPHCRQNLITFSDGKSAQEVKALKIKCENLDNGCQWVGELRSLEDHKAECDYVLVLCPNECGSNKLQRKDLDSHKANECPKREYQCPLCDKIGSHKEQTTTHLTTCPKVMVQCPNNDCGEDVLRFMLESHRSECEYERTPCKFAKFGCELEAARKDIKAHEEDDKLHLQSTKEKVLQLIEQLEKQEEITRSLSRREYISPITFKVTNCTENKLFKTTSRSPDFYSSKGGCMFSIRLMPTKENETLQHDIDYSVFLCGEIGENDHFLSWPIRVEAKVQLLNQLEDSNHKTPLPSSHVKKRYHSFNRYDIRRRSLGTINSKSISHNCQYLKDDTLIFRVTIQESIEKPWLKCIA